MSVLALLILLVAYLLIALNTDKTDNYINFYDETEGKNKK